MDVAAWCDANKKDSRKSRSKAAVIDRVAEMIARHPIY